MPPAAVHFRAFIGVASISSKRTSCVVFKELMLEKKTKD